MLIYTIVTTTALAGMLKAPWWVALAGASLLVLTLSTGPQTQVRLGGADAATSDAFRMIASIINGSGAAILAFAAGHGTAWLWGI